LVSSFNSASESVMQFVRGASFDKKEFKRNLAGSGSYPPVYTVVASSNICSRSCQHIAAPAIVAAARRTSILAKNAAAALMLARWT
jgi:hypothetical protein